MHYLNHFSKPNQTNLRSKNKIKNIRDQKVLKNIIGYQNKNLIIYE